MNRYVQIPIEPRDPLGKNVGPVGMIGAFESESVTAAREANQLGHRSGLLHGLRHQLRLLERYRLIGITVKQQERGGSRRDVSDRRNVAI